MSTFTITTPSPRVTVDGDRHASVPFTVENGSGRALDVQAVTMPVDGANPAWFTVAAPTIVHLDAGGRTTYRVEVQVPAAAPAGDYAFLLVASDVLDPEDRYTNGPQVAFRIEAKPKPVPVTDAGYVPTFLGAFAGDVVLVVVVGLIAGGIAFAYFQSQSPNGFSAFILALILAVIVVLIALVVGGPVGAGLGAFLVLRARHQEAPGWTGIAVGVAQLVVLLPIVLALTNIHPNLPRAVMGVIGTLVILIALVIPPVVGRGVVLLIRGHFVWPWLDIFHPRPA